MKLKELVAQLCLTLYSLQTARLHWLMYIYIYIQHGVYQYSYNVVH